VSDVIAIEPSCDNFALLQCNIHLNKLHHKIRAIHAAASDANDMVHLLISSDSSGDHRVRDTASLPADTKIETIASVTIDAVVKDRVNEIAFMWIDVQGYEYYVLRGARSLISNSRTLAIQMEFWPLGLEETKTLGLLCQFCKKHFSKYIDIREYLNPGTDFIYDINKIDSLATHYKYSYTDIFLIP
jgi:FkbM family methyltransferase